MRGPREILNELKWREDQDLARAEIHYVHRGAPGDAREIPGRHVIALHTSFMEIQSAKGGPGGTGMIPYHRVFRIDYEGEPLWERRSPASPAPSESDEGDNANEESKPGPGRTV